MNTLLNVLPKHVAGQKLPFKGIFVLLVSYSKSFTGHFIKEIKLTAADGLSSFSFTHI
jgi:hypothetical protein